MKLTLWKIGTENHPATPESIADFKRVLEETRDLGQSNEHAAIVTHHAVSFDEITIDDDFQIITVSQEQHNEL